MTWTTYRDSRLAWKDMLDACKAAEHSIDLEQFIFIPDDIGKQFIDICAEKAKQGVSVRYLWDAAGSFSFFGSSIIEELQKKGIALRFFKTLIPRASWNHRFWFFRNHRRSLVIDEKIAFTGSASIWEETHDWTETHIKIEGSVVSAIQNSFEETWKRSGTKIYRWKKELPQMYDGFAYITNSPVRKIRYLYKAIYDALAGAQKNINITTPYFCPDHTMMKLIIDARKRGVSVSIVLPYISDHYFIDIASYSFFNKLLKHGVDIYLYQKGMIHSKSILVDDTWATIGTLNFDNVSLRYNFEANIVSTHQDFVHELTGHFMDDVANSKKLDKETWKNRSFVQKVLEFLIQPFRSLL